MNDAGSTLGLGRLVARLATLVGRMMLAVEREAERRGVLADEPCVVIGRDGALVAVKVSLANIERHAVVAIRELVGDDD